MSWTRETPTAPGVFYYRTWNMSGLVFLGWGHDGKLWVCHFTEPNSEALERWQPVCLWHPVADAPPIPEGMMSGVYAQTVHPDPTAPNVVYRDPEPGTFAQRVREWIRSSFR